MTHQKQRTGEKKEDQSHCIVICSVHMVSIRVYIELLKPYSHLIMQLGVALISSDTFLRRQTRGAESQSISNMKRPSAHSHLRNSCDWDQGSQTCFSITKPDPVKPGVLSAWMMSVSAAVDSRYWFATSKERLESNSICYYIFIIAVLCQITFLLFSALMIDPASISTNNSCEDITDCSVS